MHKNFALSNPSIKYINILNDYVGLKNLKRSQIKNNSLILVIGRNFTGKTTLVNNILKNFSSEFMRNSLIVSPSESVNPSYSIRYPDARVSMDLDYSEVGNYLQSDQGCIVLDDCLDRNSTDNMVINRLFYNNSKLRILCLQYPPSISRYLRSCIDQVFIFRESFTAIQRRLYFNYCNMFPNLNAFNSAMYDLTENYNCMVVNNRESSGRIVDKVFWCNSNAL